MARGRTVASEDIVLVQMSETTEDFLVEMQCIGGSLHIGIAAEQLISSFTYNYNKLFGEITLDGTRASGALTFYGLMSLHYSTFIILLVDFLPVLFAQLSSVDIHVPSVFPSTHSASRFVYS